jgi:hypothetical protein
LTYRSATDKIFCICQKLQKTWEYSGTVYQLFIVFKKAYVSVRREVFYSILIAFGISMKPVGLIKMHLNETYIKVYIVKHSSVEIGLKQRDALFKLILNFALQYDVRKYQEDWDILELNGIHQLLVHAGDDNLLGESINTIKKDTEACF